LPPLTEVIVIIVVVVVIVVVIVGVGLLEDVVTHQVDNAG
jgi:hypothetical protein